VLHLVLLLQHEIWVLLTILNCCAYSKSCDNMYCKMIKRKIKQKNAVNFRISNNLGLGLAANISAALAIQPVRDREIEIIL
jgi:hypothetical protein